MAKQPLESFLKEAAGKILKAVPEEIIITIDREFTLAELRQIANLQKVSATGSKKDLIRRLIALKLMEESREEVFRRFDEYKNSLHETLSDVNRFLRGTL